MNYHTTDDKYINPYNFVSIDEDVERGRVEYGHLRGSIVCELETLTPLFIPNTSRQQTFGNTRYSRSYDFFSYEDLSHVPNPHTNFPRPIIPGSSIKGLVRTAYEAALNGCMSTCDDENTLYRRTPVPRKDYGIIEVDSATGERVLYKASKYKWPVTEKKDHKTGDILRDGVYLRGENFPFGATAKKNDAIMRYEYDKNGNKVEITRFGENSREWANFVEVWRLYQHRKGPIKGVNQNDKRDRPDYNSGYKGYLDAKEIPVYYTKLDNGSFYYLAPAAMTKEVFSRTLKELLKVQGGHNPCETAANVCPACALFGMIGTESLASRLSFRDGEPIDPEAATSKDWSKWYDKPRALPILGGPKVSATEFYMADVDGTAYFNYDYSVNYYRYYDKGGKTATAPVRTFLEQPRLRGRKFYWHRTNIREDNSQNFPLQRSEIRPVRDGKTFRLEIVFDRLTEFEIKTLLWVLTFGQDNSTHAHKLGYGKPHGYGSVRIKKAEVSFVEMDMETLVLVMNPPAPYQSVKPKETIALKEYLRMTDYSKSSNDVGYPQGEKNKRNGPTIYNWFGINKEIKQGAFNPVFNFVLPKPLDDDISLPGYVAGYGNKDSNRGEIKWAAAPEAQSDIPLPEALANKSEGSGKRIRIPAQAAADKPEGSGNRIKIPTQQDPQQIQPVYKYGQYKSDQLKRWLVPYDKSKNAMSGLKAFVADYEQAQKDVDLRYKDLSHLYEQAKKKLSI